MVEYGELTQLRNGMSPQARGQRFNGLIAELLTAFGVYAKANVSSIGELDVTFRYQNQAYILEAKWERGKVDTTPISKLQRRVEQRMAGVRGIVLSMSGYTKPALDELHLGRRLDTLLLDLDHWEAMLSGFVPPTELLDLVLDAAEFHGKPYMSLTDLLANRASTPSVVFDGSSGEPGGEGRRLASVVGSQVAVTVGGASQLIVAADDGVLGLDLARRRTQLLAPVAGCTSVLRCSDGSLLLARAHGVGRFRDGHVAAISMGSVAARGLLLVDDGGVPWCLDGSGEGSPVRPAMIHIGDRVGSERLIAVPYEAGRVTSAAWAAKEVLAIGGNPDIRLVHVPPQSHLDRSLQLKNSYPVSLVRLKSEESWLAVAAGDGSIFVVDPDSDDSILVDKVDSIARPALQLTATPNGDVYVAWAYYDASGRPRVGMRRANCAPHLPAPAVPRQIQSMATVPPSRPNGGRASVPRSVPAPAADRPAAPPPATVAGPEPAAADSRLSERNRGYADGGATGATLPMHAFYELILVNFDVVRWLGPVQGLWRSVLVGQAPPSALPRWLPLLSRQLGSVVAPAGHPGAYFSPDPAYLAGFTEGLSDVWSSAVRARLVPWAVHEMPGWLQGRTRERVGMLRSLATITDLKRAVRAARVRTTLAWIGRAVLWIMMLFFAIGTSIFVGIEVGLVSGKGLEAPLGGLLFYAIPFAGMIWFTIYDIRRLVRGQRVRTRPQPAELSTAMGAIPERQPNRSPFGGPRDEAR